MILRILETFFYIIISNTQIMIYFSMVLSMFLNAGIISLINPIAVFGYAMLEETRPQAVFWTYVRRYTIGILFFKFFLNLQVMNDILKNKEFIKYESYIKLGIYDYEDICQLMFYMLPEILTIVLIMLNEI